MVTQACNPSLGRWRQEDCGGVQGQLQFHKGSEASLGYMSQIETNKLKDENNIKLERKYPP